MMKLIFLLLFLILNVDGVKGVMPDSDVHPSNDTEDDVSGSGSAEDNICVYLVSDDEDIPNCSDNNQTTNETEDDVSGSGSDEDEIPCSNMKTIIFSTGVYSTVDVLNNVTTSNTIINISTDVVLSSIVTLEGLDNIRIIGQGNSTVNCNDIGSVKFISCNNVTIEGVIWERCGFDNAPGIEFYNSSNIVLQSSSFHHSVGQAVVLSNMLGNVYINDCQFTHNKYYKGHGAAIYHTSSPEQSTQVQLVINNCDISFNGPAESVVYIDNSNNKVNGHISLLQNSTLIQNKGVPIYISHTSLVLNNSVSFKDNNATAGGGIYSRNSIITFDDKCNVSFHNNSVGSNGNRFASGRGGAVFAINSIIYTNGSSKVTFSNNYATFAGGAIMAIDDSPITFNGSSSVTFSYNHAGAHGGAAFVENSPITFHGSSTVIFSNNHATYGGAIQTHYYNYPITFHGNSKVTFSNNYAIDAGGAIIAVQNSPITFNGNSIVTFSNNSATNLSRYGGAVYAATSPITFQGSSTVKFSKNHATGGGVIMAFHSPITFNGSSTVTFSNNCATTYGGAVRVLYSPLAFHGSSTVTFSNNSVTYEGGAIYADDSPITFHGSSTVTFSKNHATSEGGAIKAVNNSPIIFHGSSTVTFRNNINVTFIHNEAIEGGAIYLSFSDIIFTGIAIVNFYNNTALLSGGAISSLYNSNILFTGESTIYFNNNLARQHGGAISSVINTRITFNETCSVMFTSNTAMQQGGAIYLLDKSTILFGDNCNVTYDNNAALQQGGALYFALQSNALFKGNSIITFEHNKAILSGGALYSFSNYPILFEENCILSFNHNMVRQDGGAIQTVNTTLYFSGSSSVTFTSNTAMQQGGAVNLFYKSILIFQDDSNVTFTRNSAMQNGGAVYVHDNTNVSFVGNTTVVFHHNMAESDGGALYSYYHCNITIRQYSEVIFDKNSAMQYGGAMYCDHHSDVTLEGNNPVSFTSNTAEHGGAVCVSQSVMTFAHNSVVMLSKNRAIGNGGAVLYTKNFTATFNNGSSIKFDHNTAYRYGGALYIEVNHEGLSKLRLNTTGITFTNNRALIGDSVYVDIPTSCGEACLNRTIVGVNKETLEYGSLAGNIYTPPSKLVLGDPAVCIDDDNVSNCGKYYVNNIMLGQEIIIDACVRDYYDQRATETQFMVDSNDKNHTINGTNSVLISCDNGLQGINITGSKISDITNFTMNLTFHDGSWSNLKTISIGLIIELSPCHPGFYYDSTTKKCVCYYDDDDIITCSDSTSLIRRGYWFGIVNNNKSTVTVCPNNYCDFTCCEATNGFYELSPMRMNQCSSHRSGTACGSCEEGYTLSFDSVECVSVDQCTTGQTVMVVTLSMIYWIIIVLLVFIMTYYHVGIGYLYAITYYYSMLDILLSQNLYQSKGLFTTVTTLSSLVKITPQFLGQLCLVKNMSGIDQQFIHYTHPLAVSVIIVIICQSARISHKFSSFISRGIIRTVCFLLLLSYTSVATTSLLLLRSLTFDNVDKVYTYLSPDIEYCHGRHLPYFIVAVLCTLVIVIGLPLLLLLEPFLNKKINFTRMKPLLDQFQGCYKDKYRCFAAYYMICRLVIIVIIIAIPSNSDLSQFLLIFSSGVLAVVVIVLKPYQHKILNIFDGLILQLVVLATLIPLADTVSQKLSTATIIIVMFLPLISFIALELILHKETITTITTKIAAHFKTEPVSTCNDTNEVPMGDIGIIIDDNMRKNATICEM